VVERDSIVERDVKNRLFFAVVFVRQLAVLELHHLTFGQEGDLDRIFAGSFFGGRPGALGFFLVTFFCSRKSSNWQLAFGQLLIANCSSYSNSAFAMGCGAVGPSPMSASSMVLPFSTVETALSIISSASRVVP